MDRADHLRRTLDHQERLLARYRDALRESIPLLMKRRNELYDSAVDPIGNIVYVEDENEIDAMDRLIDECYSLLEQSK